MENNTNKLQKLIGLKVRGFRTKRDLTQEGLASMSGLHTTFIAHIESGRKVCSIKSLNKIASALGMPIHLFFTGEAGSPEIVYDQPTRKIISMVNERTDAEKEMIISIAASLFRKSKKPRGNK